MSANNQFQPGAILVAAWGYEQTNVDYYQVISRTEKTVTVREINRALKSNGYGLISCPVENQFRSEPIRRKIHHGYIVINPVVNAYPYTGETYFADATAHR